MKSSAVLFLIGLIFALESHATFAPQNNRFFLDDQYGPSNVTEAEFVSLTDRFVAEWETMARLHGAELVTQKLWSSSEPNAYAIPGKLEWGIQMHGGLARLKEMTPDGFAAVVCHELGHHFGGYVTKWDGGLSAEGQADYFATQICLRNVWITEPAQNRKHRESVAPAARARCDLAWSVEAERDLCYRIANAGQSLGNVLAELGSESAQPSYEIIDATQVPLTQMQHPKAQCRLDTYLAGAICKATFDPSIIPGRYVAAGQGSIEAEQEASRYSCMQLSGFAEGLRPRCWFAPLSPEESR